MNRQIAQREGLLAVSAKEFVDGLNGDVREALVDLVVGGVDEIEPSERRGRRIYDEVRGRSPARLTRLTRSTCRKMF
jgi:exosome complex exonuclease DIS3/RRP44